MHDMIDAKLSGPNTGLLYGCHLGHNKLAPIGGVSFPACKTQPLRPKSVGYTSQRQ